MGKKQDRQRAEDSWATTTGLLDDFDFVVEEEWFGTDDLKEVPDGVVYLFLIGDAVDADGEIYDEHRERFGIGKGWDVVEGGAEVEKATGKSSFNQNTGVGRLIDAIIGLGSKETAYIKSKGRGTEAATYHGLSMHMENTVRTFKADDGEDAVWNLNLPTSLDVPKKGKGGSGKASRSVAKKPAKDKGNKPKKSAVKVSGLRADIAEFASEFKEDEHRKFAKQVLDENIFEDANAIYDDDELAADVLDSKSDLWLDSYKRSKK